MAEKVARLRGNVNDRRLASSVWRLGNTEWALIDQTLYAKRLFLSNRRAIITSMMTKETLTAGLDEAGRGCVIGPLVIAIVVAEERDRRWFAAHDVRDSKVVPPKKRDALAESIRERCWHRIVVIEPEDVDDAVFDTGRSLNDLEMETMVALAKHAQQEFASRSLRVTVDAFGRNEEIFLERFRRALPVLDGHDIRAMHHADALDRSVGAASIIAKTERERCIAELKKDIGRDFGSGYCSDPVTTQFLREFDRDHPMIRKSWKTVRGTR
jgi:ribonuclease HII